MVSFSLAMVVMWCVMLVLGIRPAAANEAPEVGPPQLRQYYMTANTHNGANALSACADGYHMASLWEIYDTSNLSYNTSLGKTTGDSGLGPPTYDPGWVRTGWIGIQSGQNKSGIANCVAWMSANGSLYGSVARVQPDWENDHGPYLFPNWQTATYTCDTYMHVWCVENTIQAEIFLPLVMR
jgi:hypothetical protein